MLNGMNFFSRFAASQPKADHTRDRQANPQPKPCHDEIFAAIVTQTIAPGKTGQVKFQGTWWTARCSANITLALGEVVHVIRRQSLTLYVEPCDSLVVR